MFLQAVNKILLSFIIPVYNTPLDLLRRCISTLTGMSYHWIEIIIVDDGSREDVAQECDTLSLTDNRIQVVHQENQGVSVARNRGIELVSGKYIVFVDPDDYVLDALFDKPYFESMDSDILLFSYFRQTENKNSIRFIVRHNVSNVQLELAKNILFLKSEFGTYMGGAIWAKAFKTSFIRANHLYFDPQLRKAQDRIFMLNVLSKTKDICISEKTTYTYYENIESICNVYKPGCSERSMAFYKAAKLFVESGEVNGIDKNLAIGKLAFLTFFEILYLDYFNIKRNDPYYKVRPQVENLYNDMKLKSTLNSISLKDCFDRVERTKLFLVKSKLFYALFFLIRRNQQKRLSRKR